MSDKLRITTDSLPAYTFPVRPINPADDYSPFAISLVQAREDGEWVPKWLIVDSEGSAVGRMEADSFEDIDEEIVAYAAMNFVLEMHGINDYIQKIELFPIGLVGI